MEPEPAPRATVSLDAVTKVLDLIVSDHVATSSIHSALAPESISHEARIRLETQAEQVRGSFWRWRRREQELSAILSGVRELAELRDVDELLDRIVDRARGLMGADVAYLTEHHDDALKVRTTSGVVAPELRDLLVPVGMGLASKIVKHRTPQWTSTYAKTYEIPHEAGVDDAVAAEGLVSLLGVPLLAGAEVLGALFAANRTTYEFSPDEIALLGAFADHAAIVLQTARLLETARSAAEEAREATDVLSENIAAMERATRVHEDLTSVVVRGGSAQEIAATLSSALGRRVIILDRDHAAVADAPAPGNVPGQDLAPTGAPGDFSQAVLDAIDRSRHSGQCVPVSAENECDFAVAVVSEDAVLGALLMGPGQLDFGAVERRTVERAAQIMALVTLKQDAIIDAENRVSDELVTDVLNPRTPNNEAVSVRARARGVHLDQVRSVTVIVVPADVRRPALDALRQMGATTLAGEEDELLVALSTRTRAVEVARETRLRLKRSPESPVLAVAGPPVRAIEDLPGSFETARRCAGLVESLGRKDDVVDALAYKPYLAMFGTGDSELPEFVDAVIGPVVQWDEQRGGDLVATLGAFIDSHASPTRTARQLHVHVNTVLQRLERITTLLGGDWREPDPLFRVSVAVRMHALAEFR
ncbi:MAG: helix-turn-helix domain-containing protein [Nocardioides sp.]|nr:helix-turn-helix domain-containing protein [Nocardioides sp.]